MRKKVTILGAGLSGCEAALQLAESGFDVTVFDVKPNELLPAYTYPSYAELICNNSFGKTDTSSPSGLLLMELRTAGCILLKLAETCKINDSKNFAVDKSCFSEIVSETMIEKGVEIFQKKIMGLPYSGETIIVATGPLTNYELLESISSLCGDISCYHFSDASCPIVDIDTVDLKNENIEEMNKDLYEITVPDSVFRCIIELLKKEYPVSYSVEDQQPGLKECKTIEELAKCSNSCELFSRFTKDEKGNVLITLRRESSLKNGFILVGCMTRIKHSSQQMVFSLIPGLEKCKIIKFGRMHRNSFFDAPRILNNFFRVNNTEVYLVGQLSGLDGYAPAIASGLISSWDIANEHKAPHIPTNTMMGGLSRYVCNNVATDFQPMTSSFSLIDNYDSYNQLEISRNSLQKYVHNLKI